MRTEQIEHMSVKTDIKRLSMCGNKRRHTTWTRAAKVAKRCREQTDHVYVPYICPYCQYAHVGEKHDYD